MIQDLKYAYERDWNKKQRKLQKQRAKELEEKGEKVSPIEEAQMP